jgi:hypothetical protein
MHGRERKMLLPSISIIALHSKYASLLHTLRLHLLRRCCTYKISPPFPIGVGRGQFLLFAMILTHTLTSFIKFLTHAGFETWYLYRRSSMASRSECFDVRSQKLSNVSQSLDGWPKIYYFELLRPSEGTLSQSRLQQSLAPTALGPRGGLWPVLVGNP